MPQITRAEAERMINIYGYLKHEIGLAQAHGQRPNPQSVADMQKIEAHARANFSPEQMAYAERASNEVMAQQRGQYEAVTTLRDEGRYFKMMDKIAHEATKGMGGESKGLSAAQFDQVRKTGKVTTPTGKRTYDADKAEKFAQKNYGVSMEVLEQRLDDLEVASRAHDKAKYKSLLKDYGIAHGDVVKWGQSGGGILHGLNKRFAEQDKHLPETETYDVSPQDDVRADLISSWMEVGGEIPTDHQGSVNEELLEEDSRHGDVARAFDAVESAESYEEYVR